MSLATLVFRMEHGEIDASACIDVDAGRLFSAENLRPGSYLEEQMTPQSGAFVYVPCGTLRPGDEGVNLTATE